MVGRLSIPPNAATVLLFGSQPLSFGQPAFRSLTSSVLSSDDHSWALRAIDELPEQWELIRKEITEIAAVPGAAHLAELSNWFKAGTLGTPRLPNVLLSPLVIIAQLTQYTTYASLREPEALPASEAVGFCMGLLSAIVVSSSATKREFEKNAAAAVRLALLIGAAVDTQDIQDDSGESTTFSVAARSPEATEKVKKISEQFPEAYVSVVYDENTYSITTARRSAPAVEETLKSAKCIVAEIGLGGRFHSQKHATVVQRIMDFCTSNSDFSLGNAAALRTPLRSNSGDGVVAEGSLHEVAVRAILLDTAEWYKTFAQVKSAHLDANNARVLSFGPEKCVPPSLLRGIGSRVLHFEDVALPQRSPDEIAVVGLAIHVAGADDADEFWQLLAEGKSQHKPVPRDRFSFDSVFRENDTKKTWYGNFLNHHDAFDHKFFKKTPRESASMDPQQRLLMQVAYQVVEQSGYFDAAARTDSNIGCYFGVCGTDYAENVACHPANAFTATGNLRGFIAGKISHYFGWTGPGLTIDTACSGSAVSVHQACRAILSGECTAALAGGTNTMSHPVLFQNLAGASFLSPTGQCKPFDALADGYCRGEAVGAVFLKKMSAAVADGDQILGVISSTAVQQNQNCTPIVVPNAPSLSDLFRKVVRRSGLEPSQVSVVEAHGTGTPVGDPAEYESIRRVFGGSSREKPLQLGSVKGLVGHTEGSSGVVSLAKILLMLQEGSIPPQASFSTINPAINATAADKMHIATSLQPWDAEFKAALINNYGASGSNASMLVTQAPRLGSGLESPAGPKYPFWLCGLDDRSIRAYATRLRRFLKTKNPSIADLSFNMARQSNRSLERAQIFTASSIEELDNKLTALESGDASPVSLPAPRPLILCFGGQISTSVGLDRQVYDNVAVLRRYLDRCDATAQTLGVGSIYPHVFQKETIKDIVSLQTALFALQYATAKSWIDCGVEPAAVVGHSFGELTALCISGVLSLQDAMKAVIARATIIRDAWGPEKGSMLAVEADADKVNQLIAASNTPATIACFNGPTSHTIAGSVATIDTVVATITAKFPTLKFKRLNVSNAYHSTLVEALKPQLRSVGEGLTFNKPTIPVERATETRAGDIFSSDFFAEHLRNPVYFSHAVNRLAKEHPNAIWLEAGSNATVTFMASKALGSSESHHFQAVNVSGTQSLQKLIDTTTTLWKAGLRVAYWGHSRLQTYDYALLLLPPYQFDRQKHWLALKEPPKATAAAGVAQPALFTFAGYQDNEQRLARFRVNTSTPEYEAIVGGHKIAGTAPICPATVQIDLAIEALRSLQPPSSSALLPQVRDITNLVPVCVDPSRSVWLELEALDSGRLTWAWKMTSTSSSPANAAPTTHVTGEIALSSSSDEFARYERQVSHARCMQLLQDDDPDEVIQGSRSIYRVFSEIVDYGERYHGLQKLVGKGHESAGRITKTHSGQSWLDAFLGDTFCQVGGIWVNCMTDRDPGDMYIANGIKRWARSPKFAGSVPQSHGEWHVFAQHSRAADGNSFLTDVFVFEAKTASLVEVVEGINYAKVSKASMSKLLSRLTSPSSSAAADTSFAAAPPAAAPEQHRAPAAAKTATRSSSDIIKQLKEILADISGLEVEEILDDIELADIGVDSLMGMEMAREIETAFQCTLSQDELMGITNFSSLVSCLNGALGAGGGDESSDDTGSETTDDNRDGTPATTPERVDTPPAILKPAERPAVVAPASPPPSAERSVPAAEDEHAVVRDASDYRSRISPSDVYDSMRRVGIQHGPMFQHLKSVRARPLGSLATLEVADTAATMPYEHEHPHVIHPITLDNVFQAVYAALPDVGANMSSAQVPRTIKELWVSNDIDSTPGARFSAHTRVWDNDKQGFKAAVTVTDDANTQDVKIKIDDFYFQSIGAALAGGDPTENDKLLTARWLPALTLTAPALLKKQLAQEPDPVEAQVLADVRLVCSWFLQDALEAITPAEAQALDGHFQRYYAWMKLQAAKAPASVPALEKATLKAKVAARSVNGELVCTLGPHLADILRGVLSPLELMQERQLLYRFYAEGLQLEHSRKQMAELVRQFAHQHPRAKVLEVGAGSGATTLHALNALGSPDDPLAGSYEFTDVSDAFFAAAEEEFGAWKKLVSFKTLDIERDPGAQGFEPESYDLVIAAQVLHKTASIEDAAANVRRLLKPDGKLILLEPTRDQLDVQFAFGLLPDHWQGQEEHRLLAPSLSVSQWDAELKRSGFTGVDIEVHDCESETQYSYSVILSSAERSARTYAPEVVIATPTPAPAQEWLDQLSSAVAVITGAAPTVQPYDKLDCEGKLVVFVGELSASVLQDPTGAQFEAIRTLCTTSKGLLWVTRGGAVDSNDPFASLAQGFTRILRLEYVGKRIGTLDLDPSRDAWTPASAAAIASVFAELFADLSSPASDPRDYEFAERGGAVNVLRYFKDHDRAQTWFPKPSESSSTSLQPFVKHSDDGNNAAPLRLTIESPGQLDSLVFAPTNDYDASAPLASDELEISPRAFGISPRDVSVATGALQDNRRIGFECSGVVTRASTLTGFKPGDRVAALLPGEGFASSVRAPWTSAVRIPDDMGFELAAALPVAYASAWIALVDVARLAGGESVLVHDAGSAVGQAAVRLAQHAGADVFVSVVSPEQTAFVHKVLGVPTDRIFFTGDDGFADELKARTSGGRGVDVVLNTLEGALLQESLECVAPLGRFVELGKRDLEQSSRLSMGAFARGVSFAAVDLPLLVERKGQQVSRALTAVFDLIRTRKILGVPVSRHDIGDVVQAFRAAASGNTQGNVVLSVRPDSMVPAILKAPVAKLCPDATYVVVGGFGGIGQSICYWLAEHGARNLVVLSRSASAADKAAPLLADIAKLGCKVKPISCDIADEASVKHAIASFAAEMPPVRGVIQGAMVLRDSILEQMSLADYQTGLRPKVQGSWNLHTAFASAPLDFFIMLSSVAGVIGIASQCNYGAGGSFQDALARHRTSQGLPAVSIDIGAVKNVGYVSEHDDTSAYLKKQGHMILSEGDVLKAVECAVTDPHATQLVFGINTSPASAFWDEGGPAARDLRFWPAKFRGADGSGADGASGSAAADNLAGRIARAKTLDEASAAVAVEITAKLMDIFMMPEDEVAPGKPMAEFGVDSLTAVELRNALALKAAAEISIFDIMQSPSLTALATTIAGKSAHLSPSLASAAA